MEENIFSDFIDLFTSCGILHASEKGKGAVNKIEDMLAVLKNELAAGKYPGGTRFPSEYELAERFGVHKITANKAVSLLVNEHLLKRGSRGSGTYVLRTEIFPRGRIAFIASLKSMYVGMILNGAQKYALKNDFAVTVFAPPIDRLVELVERFDSMEYRGIISIDYGILNSPLPTVYIDRIAKEKHCVNCANRMGGTQIMEALLARGHREIVIFSEGNRLSTRNERIEGFYEAMQQYGFNRTECERRTFRPTYVLSSHEIKLTLRDILSQYPSVTAIATDSDDDAMHLIRAAREMGVPLPGKIYISGFGNLNSASGIYGFASVDQHAEKIGAVACARLIEGLPEKPLNEIVEVELVREESIPRI